MALGRRMGIIKCWFNGEEGYGFIHPDDGDEAIFVHHTGIAEHTRAKSLTKGICVTYEVARRGMGGTWAKNVYRAG